MLATMFSMLPYGDGVQMVFWTSLPTAVQVLASVSGLLALIMLLMAIGLFVAVVFNLGRLIIWCLRALYYNNTCRPWPSTKTQ